MSSIPRKPVAAATAGAERPGHTPAPYLNTYQSDLSKDIEKSEINDWARRVSTEIELPQRPVEPYKKAFIGSGIFTRLKSLGGSGTSGKKYFGLSRKIFLICVAALVAFILALAIGLGVGLSKGKKYVNCVLHQT
jgi:hypothetical protein